ncbi:hypothetical protein C7447_101858 [Tenacibaculum adriaticum]|uniref:Flavin mononucleotide-binding protein n=1 Tax=Tenacibaculum adriaticum TaxID=413713 RepID=A0A5S5DWC2_9FLAO|nr:pyridoxamine 5'-phosphate oxidase family protein [Tenacibaculum adriaticum]TYQ00248.1 hypothetical protein C7447_101858 [Tenacibaculum adriaticum]
MIKSLQEKESFLILKNNYIGNLGYVFQNKPFIAPITYFYDEEKNCIICYSNEGHKITAMRKNNNVSLEVSEISSVNKWQSALVQGTFEELKGSEATAYLHDFSLGVKDLIMRKEVRKLDYINEFSSKIYADDMPIVYLIKVEEITGRMRRN